MPVKILSIYPPMTWFYLFITYAFIGWFVETIYASLNSRSFVNRGFLNGPFCPIYGFGAVGLIMSASLLPDNLIVIFFVAMVFTSALEYLTGWIMEVLFHIKWWDYSDEPLNIQGRICLSFSLYWAVGSIILLKIVNPLVTHLISRLPSVRTGFFFELFLAYLSVDLLMTIYGLLNIRFVLQQMQQMKNEIRGKIEAIKEVSEEGIEEMMHELHQRYETMLRRFSQRHQRLLRAFPRLRSKTHEAIIQDIRDKQ